MMYECVIASARARVCVCVCGEGVFVYVCMYVSLCSYVRAYKHFDIQLYTRTQDQIPTTSMSLVLYFTNCKSIELHSVIKYMFYT